MSSPGPGSSADSTKCSSSVSTPVPTIMLEGAFLGSTVSKRAFLFCETAMEEVDHYLEACDLPNSRTALFVISVCDVLEKWQVWLNKKMMHNMAHPGESPSDMYKFAAVMVFSNRTRFSP